MVRVLVTGASGFIASGLVDRLLDTGRAGGEEFDQLTLADVSVPRAADDARVRVVEGDLTDPDIRAAALQDKPDVIFHLASIPGRATSQDVQLGYRVNVEATVALFDEIAALGGGAAVVFTSTLGVYGVPVPDPIDDDTYPHPTMSYGAQKLMAEVAFSDLVRRGEVRGRCVRLSSIVARPRSARSAKSYGSFLSDVFHAVAAGERFVLPVGPGATAWMMSRARCVDNLQHAAALPPLAPGEHAVATLPALRVRMDDLIASLGRHYGRADVDELVSYQPDPLVSEQFGAFGENRGRRAEAAGYAADRSIAELIERVGVARRQDAVMSE